jgi:TrpR family transcriptional regulator, trp operon repressor
MSRKTLSSTETIGSRISLKIWQEFLTTTETLDLIQLDLWFDILLTPAEKEDIKNRIQILKGLLEDRLSQRELAEKLGVSISKVTRGSNALKRMSPQKRLHLSEWLLTSHS